MDPELAGALSGMPYVGLSDPLKARAAMRELVTFLGAPATDERVEVADLTIPGLEGGPAVRVRTYVPRDATGPVPILLYFHGGGFVTGDLENEHRRCLDFVVESDVAVVSVDYRLAPEHPFPAAFDDCYAATVWAYGNAVELGGDPMRIAVGGGSAGGGLAAAVALKARDEGGPPLAFQLLLYPVLDDRMDTPSMHAFTEPPLFNRTDVGHMWRHYLGPASTETPVYAAPARATDLSGLPPAYVLAVEADPLRDEDVAYAQRLIQSGVRTELHHLPGVYHGFDGVVGAAVARRALRAQREALRRALWIRPGVTLDTDPGQVIR
ncbi:alpha/beta hydrolase [Thermomonospora umbrina]|uniref:Acetyl esterase/lipase n=1 Tax=Thermomonospora umbrina TaxID=111806 RepID=A0A3D9T4U4_9ACTN|nr:alpha/beta hydrolase [Thermomonospora umbrina]REE98831.1 acetyl esterase/lipase [Thermomonospora umbrina]